jgi:hypothetical protein
MESQSELEAKLALYAQQSAQVDELLVLDPANAQFLQLKTDLQNVTALTKALLIKVISDNLGSAAPDTNTISKPVPQTSSSSTSISSNSAPAGTTVTIVNTSSAAPTSGPIQVGEIVEVSGGERPFAAVVTGVINNSEYKLKYFEYPDEVTLPSTSIVRINSATSSVGSKVQLASSQIFVGLQCMCKYAVDQRWYDCKVDALTDRGCVVVYTAYGNKEEVPFAYLRPATSSSSSSSAAAATAAAAVGTSATGR